VQRAVDEQLQRKEKIKALSGERGKWGERVNDFIKVYLFPFRRSILHFSRKIFRLEFNVRGIIIHG
jgi:hypothetical protein